MVLLPTGHRVKNRTLFAAIGAAWAYYLVGFNPAWLAIGGGAGYMVGKHFSSDKMVVEAS